MPSIIDNLELAANEYRARQSRTSHPKGRPDSGGRWHPSDKEHQSCCDNIRSPSRAYPWSYMTHCRSIPHVANLFKVDEKDLKAYLKDPDKLITKYRVKLADINPHQYATMMA